MIVLGGWTGRNVLSNGRFGYRPGEFASLGTDDSPLLDDVDPGDEDTEFAWIIKGSLPSSGTLVCNDDGGMSHTGAADGSYTTLYDLYIWAPGGGVTSEGEGSFTTTFGAGGGQVYNESLSESASAADVASAIVALLASRSESVASADAITVSAVYGATMSEQGAAQDAANWGGAFYVLEIAEAGSLADAIGAGLQALAAMSEAASANDLPVVVLNISAGVSETLASADLLIANLPTVFETAVVEGATALGLVVASLFNDTVVLAAIPSTRAARNRAALTRRPKQ